ncbi:PaaX family transcriptional regulator C-terminal domain-containing protein [Catellatospora sp. KI3]|uniref:PaaX family transcriptional regulator n=1 Tax=Catellatospora sp. KI3 TaxID=3041620 RepID=UPI0024824656|nr:PaaX family transcriptional regulator C-terminal domain-containing protein [Catellatospora sp. KI3]MDI1460822.1 PaaX family transcriptional regulator C-terminal domain-containing protein [Catellatospora sp. KI3]
MPRQHAGNSSQGLAVTLMADYTLAARSWLPSAALVALLGEFDVSVGGARTTISRLARRGVLEGSRDGRHSSYRLTEPAARDLSGGGHAVAEFTLDSDSWGGMWTTVAFSIPEEVHPQRRLLRERLRWWGYAPLYDAVWLSPHPPHPDLMAELAAVAPGALSVFQSQYVHLGSASARSPIDAWDLDDIAEQYQGFIRHWSRLLPRIASGRVAGAAAVRARTEIMNTYRRFPVLDPRLPVELLPRDWPRARAREVFLAVYDGLAEPAQEHVHAVVAQAGGELDGDIRAHTVKDMGAGVVRER